MDPLLILIIKGVLITEAATHAVRSWGIFDDVRSRIASRSDFLRRLMACFECTAVWMAAITFIYLNFLDFWPITFIIIISRAAAIAHIVIDLVDALRAAITTRI